MLVSAKTNLYKGIKRAVTNVARFAKPAYAAWNLSYVRRLCRCSQFWQQIKISGCSGEVWGKTITNLPQKKHCQGNSWNQQPITKSQMWNGNDWQVSGHFFEGSPSAAPDSKWWVRKQLKMNTHVHFHHWQICGSTGTEPAPPWGWHQTPQDYS